MNKKSSSNLRLTSPTIHHLLARLRRNIRLHIALTGITRLLIWFAVAFWILLTVDLLPVKFGFQELSVSARSVALVVVAIGLFWIACVQILMRLFVRLKNESLALLVERKYPQFEESLVTMASDLGYFDSGDEGIGVNRALTDLTRATAESLVPTVRLTQILDFRRLKLNSLLALMLILSLGFLWLAQPAIAKTAIERLIGLSSKPWPRQFELKLVGMKIERENLVTGIAELGQTITPRNGQFRIARGASVKILVRTAIAGDDANPNLRREFPEQCRFIWHTVAGTSGTQPMSRSGTPQDGFQLYSIDGQSLDGISSELTFEVRGGDDRIGPYIVSIVEQPVVTQTKLACTFPSYMVDTVSGRWTPREIPLSGPTSLPFGTLITIRAETNKSIRKVYVLDIPSQQMESFEATGNDFDFQLPALDESIQREIYLIDEDELISQSPFTVLINPIDDQPPLIQTSLFGIGSAITPNARIPIVGEVKDDYGVAATWLELELPSHALLEIPLTIRPTGELDTAIDFLHNRRELGSMFELPTGPEATVSLIVKGSDRFDLSAASHIGFSDKYELDVVDDGQLLRILERQEVGQRRRLEQIYAELGEAQTQVQRASGSFDSSNTIVEPGDGIRETNEDQDSDDDAASRRLEMRMLFAQRAMMQIDKSRQEILGVADSFENIRLQLINNRIDSKDRKKRLEEKVENPLREISGTLMLALKETLVELEQQMALLLNKAPNTAENKSKMAIEQLTIVRNRLNSVLNALVKYETQNELLDIVREMINEQQTILERTKKERQERAFDGLLD